MSTTAEHLGKSTVDEVRSIAHDLRGPLNAMRLNLDLLRRGLGREDFGAEEYRLGQARQIARLDRQITTMNDVLSRVIDLAQAHDEGVES